MAGATQSQEEGFRGLVNCVIDDGDHDCLDRFTRGKAHLLARHRVIGP